MLFAFEELLSEPPRVGPVGQPVDERLRGGVVEGDGLLIAEGEGAGGVDEEGRVAVLADVLAAGVGVVACLPDALGQVEAAGVGAVGAEDSVCGEAAPVGLVDPCLAGEGFVAAKFGDVREGRVLVIQVRLHGFSPRRMLGHGEDACGGVTRREAHPQGIGLASRWRLQARGQGRAGRSGFEPAPPREFGHSMSHLAHPERVD